MNSPCTVVGCARSQRCKGLCNRHYLKSRKYGDPLVGDTYRDYDKDQGCLVQDCLDRHFTKGYCHSHSDSLRRHLDPLAVEVRRGWAGQLVDHPVIRTEDGCWEWSRYRDKNGYGTNQAHRRSWEHSMGPIPTGLQILHRCDNPPCINPMHLYPGNPLQNMQDKVARGRHRNGGTGALPR